MYKKKNNAETVSTQKYDFERRLCSQTQDLQICKKFYMSQMNPKEFVHNTAYSVQLPYIDGLSLQRQIEKFTYTTYKTRLVQTNYNCFKT